MFLDLRDLFRRDKNIKEIVSKNLGVVRVNEFTDHVGKLEESEKDFVLREQERNILLYHTVRLV